MSVRLEGYSAEDTRLVVASSALAYEASDFLYDRMGFERNGIFQISDNPKKHLQPAFLDFKKRVLDLLKERPDVVQKMLGSFIGNAALSSLIPVNSVDSLVNDDLSLVFLLLNYRYHLPDDFEADIGNLFDLETEEGRLIKMYFEASISDTEKMVDGADFVIEKLGDDEDILEQNPCFQPMAFAGINELAENVGSLIPFLFR